MEVCYPRLLEDLPASGLLKRLAELTPATNEQPVRVRSADPLYKRRLVRLDEKQKEAICWVDQHDSGTLATLHVSRISR